MTYQKLPEEKYAKLRGQAKLNVMNTLQVFNMYGMGADIPGAAEEIMLIMDIFGEAVRGKEIPITKEMVNSRKKRRKK